MTPDEIKALRRAYGDTQETFARRVGTSLATISRWETGAKSPSPVFRRQLDTLARLVARKDHAS